MKELTMKLILPAAMALALSLSGCAAMFSSDSEETKCPASLSTGVPCTSMRNAYSMSNHSTNFEGGVAANDMPVSSISVSLPQPVVQPMPVLEPAKVMRVWINKWVDADNNLNYPTLVFTEVTSRRWAVNTSAKAPTAQVVTAYRIEPNADTDAAMVSSNGKPVQTTRNPLPTQMQNQSAQSTPLALPVGQGTSK